MVKRRTERAGGPPWLLLIHQIPPKPDYFRVKVRRRLQRLGALPIKNSVYVLPVSDQSLEDFGWLAREIADEGGEAAVCEASFVAGLGDDQVRALFVDARNVEYHQIADAARVVGSSSDLTRLATEIPRLRRRLARVTRADFFDAPERRTAENAVAEAQRWLRASTMPHPARARGASASAHDAGPGQTWVTRRDVHVDRIASAWLIRRFIDPQARFEFVSAKGYAPRPGVVRFDMLDAEYTHEGDRCTFQTLVARFGLRERALRALGEIVHDIDCKDEKFGRDEAPGVALLIAGIVRASADDAFRIERGAAVFDDLYAALGRRVP